MHGHLQAFHHRTVLALTRYARDSRLCSRTLVMLICSLAGTFGCATADLIETPRPSASLEALLASEDTASECLKFSTSPRVADDTQTSIWQEMVGDHLKECGPQLTQHYLKKLVVLPTVPGNLDAREAMKSTLVEFATTHAVTFTTVDTDDLWILELGQGDPLVDFVTVGDIQPGPNVMPLARRRTVPAYAVTTELGRTYGRGVEDNKAAIAAVLSLFQSLQSPRKKLPGKLRLIVLPNSKVDLEPVARWNRQSPGARYVLRLNSAFPVSNEVLGSDDLTLRFPQDQAARLSASAWKVEALGGGHSANHTPQEALLALKYRGGDFGKFLAQVDLLQQLAQETLAQFGDALSVDIRPLIDELKALIVVRAAPTHYSTASFNANPLYFLGHLSYQLDILQNHGFAALEFLKQVSPGNASSETHSRHPALSASATKLTPVMLRFSAEIAELKLRRARSPTTTSNESTRESDNIIEFVQSAIWSLGTWDKPPSFQAGYKVALEDPLVQLAMDVYQESFPDNEAPPAIEPDGSIARLFPNSIGFGPLMPTTKGTHTTLTESLPTKVVNQWALMLFEIVRELPVVEP